LPFFFKSLEEPSYFFFFLSTPSPPNTKSSVLPRYIFLLLIGGEDLGMVPLEEYVIDGVVFVSALNYFNPRLFPKFNMLLYVFTLRASFFLLSSIFLISYSNISFYLCNYYSRFFFFFSRNAR